MAARLKPLTIPDSVKADLWDLKAKAERPPDFKTTNEPPSPSLWQQAGEAVDWPAVERLSPETFSLASAPYRPEFREVHERDA